MRAAIVWSLLLLGAAPSDTRLPVHIGGRVVREADGALRFGWPGVYVEAHFRGTGVTVAAEPKGEQLALLIDGKRRQVLSGLAPARVKIDGLAPGEHVVRLEKLTETQTGSVRFLGFWPTEGGQPRKAKARARQIEFIGDSHTVGYGDTASTRTCTREQVHDTTDTQQAFGPLLAKRLDADYRVIAYSGYGIVRNYNGGVPGDSLPKRYPRAIPGEDAPEAASDWQPQLVVINLGTNDFSTPVHAGEPWKDLDALRADYRTSYTAFVRTLRAKYPHAHFLLLGPDLFYRDVAEVAAQVGGPVVALHLAPLELTGCDWHPSLKDQRAMADEVGKAAAAMPRLWGH